MLVFVRPAESRRAMWMSSRPNAACLWPERWPDRDRDDAAAVRTAGAPAPCEAGDLDAPLVALARAGAPLRRALARLAGRLLARGHEAHAAAGIADPARAGPTDPAAGWETLGFARAGDYAREQLGMSAQEIGDLARVDAALVQLPRVEAAWLAGRITWTKVRLLARVATEQDEAAWLAVALHATAPDLARRVREVDRGCLEARARPARGEAAELDARGETDESGAPEEACETFRIPCPARVVARWGAVRRLAWRVAGERMSAADCAEAVTAEALSALLPLEVDPGTLAPRAARLGARAKPERLGPGEPQRPVEAGVALAPAASPFIGALTEGLSEASPRELEARLRRAVALERTRLARLGPLLLELADARGYRDLGFASLDAWARERLGMAPRAARALLRLERACRRSAALRCAWRAGALSWSKAQTLVAIVLAEGSAPWVAAWMARAEEVTVRRLEDDVDRAITTGNLDPAALPELPVPPDELLCVGAEGGGIPAGVQIGVDTTAAADGESTVADIGSTGALGWRWRSCVRIHGPVAVVRLLRACLFTVQRRIERRAGRASSQGEALEALLDHVIESWTVGALGPRRCIPREHRVFARDGWRCVVPGCSSYRNLHAHHIRFRSAGGCDRPSNLTTLCAAHHQRGVHAGHIRIAGRAPGHLRFELPLGTWRSGDRRATSPRHDGVA
jgi:hypothetical protein